MQTLFYEHVNLDAGRRFTPDAEAADWSVACTDYEDGILRAGGIDLTFLAVGPDGSIAYNVGAPELAPVTHVERTQDGRVVTVGLGTVMGAQKIVAYLVGGDKAAMAGQILNGPVTPQVPATYLQLHANVVFLLDEAAAAQL